MFRYTGLGLLALLRRIRSIGHTLKSFILRFLLFRPHFLRSLRRIWSLCFGTSPKDIPKKNGGQARPSFPGASGVCEGYSAIYASRDFNNAGEPHLPLGPGNAEVLHLSPIVWQSQSVPHSPSSSRAPSLHGSPRRSDRQLSVGSTPSIADSIHSATQLPIRRLNTPLTLTHSRVTSTQFAGAPRPDRSRSPSPSPFPHSPPFLQSSTLESSGNTQILGVSPIPQDTSEGSRRSSIDINVSPPSRSQSPTTESIHSTQDPSDPRGFGSPYFPEPLVLSPDQVRYRPSFPQPSTSSFVAISFVDASGVWPDGKMRSIGLMHSEQVSRYVNKGDV